MDNYMISAEETDSQTTKSYDDWGLGYDSGVKAAQRDAQVATKAAAGIKATKSYDQWDLGYLSGIEHVLGGAGRFWNAVVGFELATL